MQTQNNSSSSSSPEPWDEVDRMIARHKRNQWLTVFLFLGLCAGWIAHSYFQTPTSRAQQPSPDEQQSPSETKTEKDSSQHLQPLRQSSRVIARITDELAPSVVNISTKVPRLTIWGIRKSTENQATGLLIDRNGLVLTNFHVVKKGSSNISVTLHNKKRYEDVKLVGADKKHDLALLKIESDDTFEPAKIGDSKSVNVGEWVIAVGNPFGLEHSVSMGIISALDRGKGTFPFTGEGFLQTDAAINPGNSGGPLVNLKGNVIGINSMIFSKSGGSQGIGFSIPINAARKIIERMKSDGYVRWGYIGVKTVNFDQAGLAHIQKTYNLNIDSLEELTERLGLDQLQGVFVVETPQPGPAWKAGIQEGDVLLSINGQTIDSKRKLKSIIMNSRPGDELTVELMRNGTTRTVVVPVDTR